MVRTDRGGKMSYDIIKRIRIKDNKVLIICAPNNVYPKTYREEESFSLSKIFQEEGKVALDIELLKSFEEGNFQTSGKTKYTNALLRLRHMKEYKAFDWRRSGKDYEISKKNRENKAKFNKILLEALNSKFPTDEFIISKDYNGSIVYLCKITKTSAKFSREKEEAKIYNYKEDCEHLKECFIGAKNEWRIEQIK